MSYEPIHRFDLKDLMDPGDPDKIIYGSHLQKEFDAISSELEAIEQEIESGSGSEPPSWDELTGKPSTFPPQAHTHSQSQINGLEGRLEQMEGADAALDLRIDAVEDSITDDGGFVDAPDDGKIYGRQSEDWVEIDVDLSDYYTKAESNAAYQPKGEYLTDFTEEDPTVPSWVKGITETNISNWNQAWDWGDHSQAGYLTGFTESDPTVPSHVKSISQADIANWNSSAGGGSVDLTGYATQTWVSSNYQVKGNYLTSSSLSGYATTSWVSQNYQTRGSYLTSESDPVFQSSPAGGITSAMINSWNSAGGSNFNTNLVVNGNGSQPTILMKAGAPRGPELQFAYGTQNKYMRLNSNGNLEIVSSAYSGVIFTWDDVGRFYCTEVLESSDASLKSNIRTAPKNIVSQLIGREWEDKETGKTRSGVVAQEVEEVVPHLVDTNEEGVKSVSYSGLIAYLIEEVKSLRSEIEALQV